LTIFYAIRKIFNIRPTQKTPEWVLNGAY